MEGLTITFTPDKNKSHFDLICKGFKVSSKRFYSDNEIIVVAKMYDKLVGVSMLSLEQKHDVHLDYTYVLPEYRRKGINTKLNKSAISYANLKNRRHLTANVRLNNKASWFSLIKDGFKVRDTKEHYKDGEPKIRLINNITRNG